MALTSRNSVIGTFAAWNSLSAIGSFDQPSSIVMKAIFWLVGIALNHPALPPPGSVTLVGAGGGPNLGTRLRSASGRAARATSCAVGAGEDDADGCAGPTAAALSS